VNAALQYLDLSRDMIDRSYSTRHGAKKTASWQQATALVKLRMFAAFQSETRAYVF